MSKTEMKVTKSKKEKKVIEISSDVEDEKDVAVVIVKKSKTIKKPIVIDADVEKEIKVIKRPEEAKAKVKKTKIIVEPLEIIDEKIKEKEKGNEKETSSIKKVKKSKEVEVSKELEATEAITEDTNEVITEDTKILVKKVDKVIKPVKPKTIRGAKKIKTAENTSYLRLPEKDSVIDFSDTIKTDKQIDKALEMLHSKIKAMHQVLWEVEHMDGEQALDEIMKLLFLKYLEKLVSDMEEPNKIDLFNPKYHINILEEGDDDDRENFNIAKKYIKNTKIILEDLETSRKKDNENEALNTLYSSAPNKCDIFKMITKILANHPTTKGLYSQTNMLEIKEAKTLGELIKHINSPCFDNSTEIEDLIGEIYEYFLNKYNKKKSALGQFFTPRMLMDITIKYKMDRIREILQKFPNPVIADKCMGTGGWLVKLFNAFKDINKDILLHGREFKPNTYQYGIINLISTTSKYPHKPAVGCSLTNIEDFKIHLIISNPPFKGKFDYNKLKETYNKNKCDGFNSAEFEDIYFLKGEDNTPLQFLQLYIHLLAEGGLCMIVLPYGELFFKDGKAMNEIRKTLLNKIDITDIILCPSGIFTHTDVKVCMLVFEKNSGGTKEIKFSKFQFDKSETVLQSIKHITTIKKADILKEPICSFYHMDYLYDAHVQIMKVKMPKYEWVKFGDMFDLIKGEMPSGKVVETEQEFDGIEFVKFITGAKDESWKIININKDISYCEGENVFISENGNGNCRPVKYYNGNCNYSNLVSLIKCKINYEKKINKKYIYYYLKNIQLLIEKQYQKGSCNQCLDVKNLNRMEIPIPPMETQLHVIKQIEAANGKITGLQNIVDIMKFTDIPLRFQIGLDMSLHLAEWVKFGDMFDLIKGELQSSKVEEDENGDGVLINWSIYDNYKKINNADLDGENLFISTSMPNGKSGKSYLVIKYYKGKCSYCDILSRIIIKEAYINKVNLKYIAYYLLNNKEIIENTYEKGACNKSLDVKNFNRMEIPILPIERQDFIINSINNLDKVITRWEQDIEDIKKEDTLNFTAYLEAEYKKHNK